MKLRYLISLYYRVYSYFIRIKIKLFIFREFITRNTGYKKWIQNNENYEDKESIFDYMPLISIIVPVYNVKEIFCANALNLY